MRIDLTLQSLHTGVQQKALLLLQFDLNAYAVKDLDFNSDGRHCRRIDEPKDPQIVRTLDTVNRVGKISLQFSLHKTQADNRGEKHHLPVEQAGAGQVPA